jgi:hypothetical protein
MYDNFKHHENLGDLVLIVIKLMCFGLNPSFHRLYFTNNSITTNYGILGSYAKTRYFGTTFYDAHGLHVESTMYI